MADPDTIANQSPDSEHNRASESAQIHTQRVTVGGLHWGWAAGFIVIAALAGGAFGISLAELTAAQQQIFNDKQEQRLKQYDVESLRSEVIEPLRATVAMQSQEILTLKVQGVCRK